MRRSQRPNKGSSDVGNRLQSVILKILSRVDCGLREKTLQNEVELAKDRLLKTDELALRTRAQSVKEEELKIAQQKLEIELAKSAKAVETLKADKLTPEEKDQKLKEIFGLA